MKYLYTILILGALGLIASQSFGQAPILSATIDGKSISIAYTDNNSGEDLIIRTDKSDYWNLAGSVNLYFSIENTSKDDQNIAIYFSFDRQNQPKVYEIAGETEHITPAVITATTSTPEQVRKETLWSELQSANVSKTLNGKVASKENTTFIKAGETKFFKANVKYVNKEREEFIIEAVGDKNSHGTLDPWAYTQNMNGLSTGDINGQDSWVKSVGAVNVVDTVYYGASGKSALLTNVETSYANDIADVADGTVYYALRFKTYHTSNGWISNVLSFTGTGLAFAIRLAQDSGADHVVLRYGATSEDIIPTADLALDTWYIFQVTFDCATDLVTVAYKPSGDVAWKNTLTNKAFVNAANNITSISIANDGVAEVYIDEIGPTEPTAGTAYTPEDYKGNTIDNGGIIIDNGSLNINGI